MASIYQIRQELESFAYEVDEETGEFLNAPQWDDLKMAYDEKVENIACYIKNLVSDIADFKAEEAVLAARRKAKEKKVDYLKRLLRDNMDGQKFSTVKCEVSFRRSEKVDVLDETLVPKKYLVKKVSFVPDKNLIKQDLKFGKKICGCILMENISTQIK